MWAQILCYKNQGIHWYHCNPTFLWQINFTLVRRLISALIWDISGLWNRSDGRDFREKWIDISRFLALYIVHKLSIFVNEGRGRGSHWLDIVFFLFRFKSASNWKKAYYSLNLQKTWILNENKHNAPQHPPWCLWFYNYIFFLEID